jgi:nitronate monooxygenase
MAGFATAPLTAAVSINGGLGLIGSVNDMAALDAELQSARQTLMDAGMIPPTNPTLPIGIGLLLFIAPFDSAVSVVKKHRPAVVWLSFASSLSDFSVWASAIRAASPTTKVWIQLGTVAAALEVVQSAKPDVLVMQGSDAGGHGFEKSAGIVSLVPETIDALAGAGYSQLPILAAGGIADGRGVAAALSLGASGVVMGTRFLGSSECVVHPRYREVILNAWDGGQATVRAKVFDELRGPNIWPEPYDGRAIRNESWRDMHSGTDLVEIRKRYAEAANGEDGGYGEGMNGRTMIWVGASVGLVNHVQSAGQILSEVRDGVRKALGRTRASL